MRDPTAPPSIHLVFEGRRAFPAYTARVTGHAYGRTPDEVKEEVLKRALELGLSEITIVGCHNTRHDFEAVYGPQPADHGFVDDKR